MERSLRVKIVGVDEPWSSAVADVLRRQSAEVVDAAGAEGAIVIAGPTQAAGWLAAPGGAVVVVAPGASPEEVVRWLSAGAADVVTDPTRVQEVAARVRSVARRGAETPAGRADDRAVNDAGGRRRADALVVDGDARTVQVEGRTVDLAPAPFRLLEVFVRNPHRVLTHEVLVDHVWGIDESFRFVKALHVQVKRLRDSIEEDPRQPRLIRTVRGVGYRFEPPPLGSGEAPEGR